MNRVRMTRARQHASAGSANLRPTITATLGDGPLAGTSIETEVLEGRPPKTINVSVDDGRQCRYCLADWVQSGPSARYTFLYRVEPVARGLPLSVGRSREGRSATRRASEQCDRARVCLPSR